MLFDVPHILYMAISLLVTVGLLIVAAKFATKKEQKNAILKITATVTVILHYSSIWVEYFTNGGSTAGLEGSHLFPIYPCHIMMWVFFIAAFIKNKEGKAFTVLAEFCFWVGIVCTTIGIVLNENYANNPNFSDWSIFKSMVSHSTLLFGCLYMRVGGLMKIRVFNVVSAFIGLAAFIVDGLFINWLYDVCGLPEVNAMYLLHSPYPEVPWLSPIPLGLGALLILFGALALYEYLALPVEERWYTKLKAYVKTKKA